MRDKKRVPVGWDGGGSSHGPLCVGVRRHAEVIVDSFHFLPEVQREAGRQDVDPNTAKGVWPIVRENNHCRRNEKHATAIGLEGCLALIQSESWRIFNAIGGLQGLTKIATKHGFVGTFGRYVQAVAESKRNNPDVWTKAVSQAVLTEEVFAHIAQARPDLLTRFKALLGKVKAWLRKAGIDLAYSDLDILHILSGARAAMRKPSAMGDTRSVRDGTLFSRGGLTDRAQADLVKEFGKPKFTNIDWWDKSVGTQLHKAEKKPAFPQGFRYCTGARECHFTNRTPPRRVGAGIPSANR